MNEYDSNRIAGLAKAAGYNRTQKANEIDCYVLNTCHIRAKATEKVYHDIGRLKKNYKNKKKIKHHTNSLMFQVQILNTQYQK